MRAPGRARVAISSSLLVLTLAAVSCGEPAIVAPPPVEVVSLELSVPNTLLNAVGQTVQLTALGRDAEGTPVPVAVTWTSSDPGVVGIDPTGRATAVADGAATLTAWVGTLEEEAVVSVFQVVAGLAFLRQPGQVDAGQRLDTVSVGWVDPLGSVVLRATDEIELAITEATGTGYELLGEVTMVAAAGVATFSDLAIEGSEGVLRLRASSTTFDTVGDELAVNEILPRFDFFQAADVVIGQADFATRTAGRGDAGFQLPSAIGLAPTGGPLFVGEILGDRVLGYDVAPTSNGTPADLVLGQVDFVPNRTNQETSDSTLNRVEGLATDGSRLVVTEAYTSRVVIWNEVPSTSNQKPDVVVPTADFETRATGTSRSLLNGPRGVALAGDRLIVVDGLNNRVLIWNSVPTTNGTLPDVVLGQIDFDSAEFGTSASHLNTPSGVWSDGVRLVVADSGNDRVLVWESIPTENGTPADYVVGAPGFDPPADPSPVSARSLDDPHGVTSDGDFLYVSDTGRHRILVFPFPTRSGGAAVGVIGQTDFTLSAPNDPDQDGVEGTVPAARTLDRPTHLTLSEGRLYVTDEGNNRVLRFTPVR